MSVARCCCEEQAPITISPLFRYAPWEVEGLFYNPGYLQVPLFGYESPIVAEGAEFERISVRFFMPSVDIPQGATILSALQNFVNTARDVAWWRDSIQGKQPPGPHMARSLITGEAADNATEYTTVTNLNAAPRTTQQVVYDIQTETYAPNEPYVTVNFGNVVQEIVNRPGWVQGNAMQIFYDENGSDQGRAPTGIPPVERNWGTQAELADTSSSVVTPIIIRYQP